MPWHNLFASRLGLWDSHQAHLLGIVREVGPAIVYYTGGSLPKGAYKREAQASALVCICPYTLWIAASGLASNSVMESVLSHPGDAKNVALAYPPKMYFALVNNPHRRPLLRYWFLFKGAPCM
jgi:hypothetical protein